MGDKAWAMGDEVEKRKSKEESGFPLYLRLSVVR
jgi:hypothetical protein